MEALRENERLREENTELVNHIANLLNDNADDAFQPQQTLPNFDDFTNFSTRFFSDPIDGPVFMIDNGKQVLFEQIVLLFIKNFYFRYTWNFSFAI